MFLATIGIVAAAQRGFPPYGTIISYGCQESIGNDACGNYQTGTWELYQMLADGYGGSFNVVIGVNTGGCWYPLGYILNCGGTSEASIGWSFGGTNGSFLVGYTDNNTYADGYGGSFTNGFNKVAQQGDVAHSYTDGNNNYTLYWDDAAYDLLSRTCAVSGTVLGTSCELMVTYDAVGSQWSVPALRTTLANGDCTEGYSYATNTMECGYYPAGFYISYSSNPLFLSYYSQEALTWVYWTYGSSDTSVIADGNNGATVGASENRFYSAGYIFYSYYDGAGNHIVNYVFDGLSGYYETYG